MVPHVLLVSWSKIAIVVHHNKCLEFSSTINPAFSGCFGARSYPSMTRHPVIFTASLDDKYNGGNDIPSITSATDIHVEKKESCRNNSSTIKAVPSHLTLGEANVSCLISLVPIEDRDDTNTIVKVNSSSVLSVNRFIFGVNAISTKSTGRFTLELKNCHSPVLGPLRSDTPPISFNMEEKISERVGSSTKSGAKRLPAASCIVGNFILHPLTVLSVMSERTAASHLSDDLIMKCNILKELNLHSSTGSGTFFWVISFVIVILLCCSGIASERKRKAMMKSKDEFKVVSTCMMGDDKGVHKDEEESSTFNVVVPPACITQRWQGTNQEKRTLSYHSAPRQYTTYRKDPHGIDDFNSPTECSSAETIKTLNSDENTDDERLKQIIEGPKYTLSTSRGDFVVNVRNGQCLGSPKQQHSFVTATQLDQLNSCCRVDESVWHVEGIEHDDEYDDSRPSTSGGGGK